MSRQFFKNAAFLSVVEIIVKLKGFIFIPLLTRYFGTVNYGVWSQVGVLVATLTPLIVLGTDSAIIRMLPGRALDKQKRQFSAWCIFLLAISVIICSLLLLFMRPISHLFFGTSEEYILYLPLAAASLFVALAMNILRNWYRIHNDAKIYGYISIIQAVLNTFALAGMLIFKKGLYELIVYNLIADFFVVVWLAVKLTRDFGWALPDFSVIKQLVRYGLPIVPAGYAMWGLNCMDRLFLVKYVTISEIGVYSLAYSLGFMIIQIFVSPIWNMYPNMASELFNKNKMDELQKLFERSVGLILTLALPATLGIFVLGKQLLSLLATSQFVEGYQVIGIITAGYIFHILSSYYDVALGLIHKQYFSTISILIAFVVNFLLNCILIPKYGILGAAIATSVGFFSQFLVSLSLASLYTKIKSPIIYPIKILASSLTMGITLFLIVEKNTVYSVFEFIFLILFGVVIYFIILLISKTVTVNQLIFLKSSILSLPD